MKTKQIISLIFSLIIILTLASCKKSEVPESGLSGTGETESRASIDSTNGAEPITTAEDQVDKTETATVDESKSDGNVAVDASTAGNGTTTQAPTSSKTSPPETSTIPSHTHSYAGASCIQPAKCTCGATTGSALGF